VSSPLACITPIDGFFPTILVVFTCKESASTSNARKPQTTTPANPTAVASKDPQFQFGLFRAFDLPYYAVPSNPPVTCRLLAVDRTVHRLHISGGGRCSSPTPRSRTLYMLEDTSCAYNKYPPAKSTVHSWVCTPCCSTYRPETHMRTRDSLEGQTSLGLA
jgi:hypothetical protein